MELYRLSAFEIAKGIRSRDFSATEVVASVIEHAKQIQEKHNAFVTLDEANAVARAREIDNTQDANNLPLWGVPFTAKDLLDSANLRTSYGSRALSENVPTSDTAAIERMRRAGAILIGKTTTPEFATQIRTDSLLCGVTTNPWDESLSPGGSSGGAGVAVATGASPIDVSTDGAGSSRVPAAACGILGLKPTLGAIPHETWPFHYGNNSTISINARTPKDLIIAFNTMAGPHALDPWTRRAGPTLSYPNPALERERRVLYLPTMGGLTADRAVLECLSNMLSQLEAHVYRVDISDSDRTGFNPSIVPKLMTCNLAARFRGMSKEQQALLNPALHPLLDQDRFKQDAVVLQSEAIDRSRLYDRVEKLFTSYDLIITPTLAAKPPSADPKSEGKVSVNNQLIGLESWWTHLGLVNMTGHPAISIPCGSFDDDLPIGLHAIGKWDGEQDLVDLASHVESISDWTERWPPQT